MEGTPILKTANRLEPIVEKLSPKLKDGLWGVSLGAARLWGRLTVHWRDFPDFMIIGTQRGGTTSLHKYLTSHPQVAPAGLQKGVHYFDTHYGRGDTWYRSHFPARSSRSESPTNLTGEASPYYMFHPRVPALIRSTIPDVKLIVLLRDPRTRAFSHHHHEMRRGFEILDFDDALRFEDERLSGEEARLLSDPDYDSFAHRHHSYLARGRYHEQLQRIWTEFPREQTLIIETKELSEKPGVAYSKVVDFLGLRSHPLEQFERLNVTSRSVPIEPETWRWLTDYFRDHDRALAEQLGWPPTWTLHASIKQPDP